MTELKHDALYAAIHAHRDALVRIAGDVAELGAALNLDSRELFDVLSSEHRSGAGKFCQVLLRRAATAERVAGELASGLERLSRIADDAMLDDTIPMDRLQMAQTIAKDEET